MKTINNKLIPYDNLFLNMIMSNLIQKMIMSNLIQKEMKANNLLSINQIKFRQESIWIIMFLIRKLTIESIKRLFKKKCLIILNFLSKIYNHQ